MEVYFGMLIISLMFNLSSRFFEDNKKIKIANALQIFALLVPIMVAGLRYNVGTDFKSYVEWFDLNLLHGGIKLVNFGFTLIIKFIQIFTENSQYLFIISAVITNICIFGFIKKNTKYYDLGYFLFIALYFYCSSLNIMRQWIAVSIFLLSLKYIYDKKFIKYFIAIIIASSFHVTAIMLVFLYFILNMKFNLKNISLVVIGIILVMLNLENLVWLFGKIFNVSVKKYLEYFSENDLSVGSGGFAYSVFCLLTLGIILFNYRKFKLRNKYADQHIILLILALLFTFIGTSNVIIGRLQYYFIPVLIVTIPNILNIIKNERIKKICYCMIVGIALLYMYRCLMHNGGHPLPYVSIFNK